MSTWIVEHGMVPLLVPEVFPPVDFSMQAHVFLGDTWHHPYILTCFCGKRFIIIRQHGSAVYVGMVVVVCIP